MSGTGSALLSLGLRLGLGLAAPASAKPPPFADPPSLAKTPVANPIPLPTSGFADPEDLSGQTLTGNGGQPRTIV